MPPTRTEHPGITVPARFIPTPSSISLQAQAFLSTPLGMGQEAAPDVDDKAGWRTYAEHGNRGLTEFTAQQAKACPADTITHELSASRLYEITPHNMASRNERSAIIYMHGGGYIVGGGEAAIYAAMPVAHLAQTRVFSLDYRMAPDHSFPAAMNDAVEAYRWMLARYQPGNIGMYGPSAGGNLVPVCLLKAQDLGLPMPAACALHSPAADLTQSGDTYETNDTIDIVLKHRSDNLMALYANGHDMKDPLLSPIFGDFSQGFPPTVLTSGTRDLLLSSTVLLHRAMRRAGVKAELHVWEAMTHAPFFNAPEEAELLHEQIQFLLDHMGTA